jgi:hypothetical protein
MRFIALIRAQQRRIARVALLIAVANFLFVSSLFAFGMRFALPHLPINRERIILFVGAAITALLASSVIEIARRQRSSGYVAKMIDDANQLDDHLVSALDFVSWPTPDPYAQLCIASLEQRLQTMKPRFPSLPRRGLWILLPTALFLGTWAFIELRQRPRTQDDGATQVKLVPQLDRASKQLEALANAVGDSELKQLTHELQSFVARFTAQAATKAGLVAELSRMERRLQSYAQSHPSMQQAAQSLGEPSMARARTLVGALRDGDAQAVSRALAELADALGGKGAPLSDAERVELGQLFQDLGHLLRTGPLAGELHAMAGTIRDPSDRTAQQRMTALEQQLPGAVASDKGTQALLQGLRTALARMSQPDAFLAQQAGGTVVPNRDAGAIGGGRRWPGSEDLGPGALASPLEESVSADTGGQGAGAYPDPDFRGGTPERPAAGGDLRLSGPWVSAPVTRLLSASAGNEPNARAALRAMLFDQRKALEEQIAREEIPPEYGQSIRAYFLNLQRDREREWKSSRSSNP